MRVAITAHVHAYKTEQYDAEKGMWNPHVVYQVFPFDIPSADRVVVCQQKVEIDIPDEFDIRSGLVANLEEEKRKVHAEFQARITAINAKIQSLKAIES